MRTLDELLKVAREAEAAYKARVEAAEQELKAQTEAAHKAQADAGAAIARGDQNAYAKAMREDEYHRGRAAMLRDQNLKPQLSPNENNAIAEEANKAYLAEVKPIYNRMCELMDEWIKSVEGLKSKGNTLYAVGRSLENAHMKDWEIDRMLPSKRPYETRAYMKTMGTYVSRSLDILSYELRREIGYDKYKKEKAAHE